ncbi:MAG: YqeG family HAD IIIA-type phosphatase [bacterium]|nr:YqeG family HAD IIIA-type phosphatase [bacterium]
MLFKYLKPFGYAISILDIDVQRLLSYNIKGIILDIDNTLVPWGSWDIPKGSLRFIQSLKSLGLKCCLLSNTDNKARAVSIGRELGLPVITNAFKPLPFSFFRAVRILGLRRENIVSIGDQLFMDVFGSNIIGIRCILVKPLTDKDFFSTRVLRILERRLIPRVLKEVEYFGDIRPR